MSLSEIISHTTEHCPFLEYDDVKAVINLLERDGCIEKLKDGFYQATSQLYIEHHKPIKPRFFKLLKMRLSLAFSALKAPLYYHAKSNGFYLQIGQAFDHETQDCNVIYASCSTWTRWSRPIRQFMDGRFVFWGR